MQLVMAGIDYKTAGVHQREAFSLTTAEQRQVLRRIAAEPGVQGCVLLSTCNRTELYISCGEQQVDAVGALCRALHLELGAYQQHFVVRRGRQLSLHLMMVASGLRSQIRGEDQILAQVKTAAALAREEAVTDPVLETMFRCAVSAAKKAKTLVPLSPVESSVAHRAVEVLAAQAGALAGKRALVIGNGEMGRLVASLLLAEGCQVTVTLRSYKRGGAVVPPGCATVSYDQRYDLVPEQDILVSATTSPHYTLQGDVLRRCANIPSLLVDLAVPRDIDPIAAELPGVRCWNVDSLGGNKPTGESREKLLAIKKIQEEYLRRFASWQSYRSRLPVERINAG